MIARSPEITGCEIHVRRRGLLSRRKLDEDSQVIYRLECVLKKDPSHRVRSDLVYRRCHHLKVEGRPHRPKTMYSLRAGSVFCIPGSKPPGYYHLIPSEQKAPACGYIFDSRSTIPLVPPAGFENEEDDEYENEIAFTLKA